MTETNLDYSSNGSHTSEDLCVPWSYAKILIQILILTKH